MSKQTLILIGLFVALMCLCLAAYDKMGVCVSTASAQGSTVVSVLPYSRTVVVGDRFTVTISISDVTNLGGFDAILLYDPTILAVESPSDVTILSAFLGSTGRTVNVGAVTIGTGSVSFGAYTSYPTFPGPAGPSGSGNLAYVVMRALQPGLSNLAFDPSTVVYDPPGDTIASTNANGIASVFRRVYTWSGNLDWAWNVGSNWSPAGVPTSYDDVIIPSPAVSNWPTVTVPSTVYNLTLQPGARLTIPDGSGLSVEGTLTNNGTLIQVRTVAGGSTTEFLHIRNAAGTVDKYHGIDITPAGDMGLTTVRVLGNQSACTTNGGTGDAALLRRCYTIDPATAQSAAVRFWYTTGELNGQPANGLHIWHYDGPPGLWSEAGAGVYGYSEGSSTCASDCWVERGGISQYSPFGVSGSTLVPTAVTLLKVEGVSRSNIRILLMTLFVAGLVGGGGLILYVHIHTRVWRVT